MKTEISDKHVVIVGAGAAGLAAACLLKQDGIATTLIGIPAQQDLRTVALMQPAMKLLKFIGVWTEALQNSAAPLRRLHIVDDTGNYICAPKLEFHAKEIGEDTFGYNIPLSALLPALTVRANELGVTIVNDTVTGIGFDRKQVTLQTDTGKSYTAAAAIAADGRESTLRKALDIETITQVWKQSALVASFSHSLPHLETSTEYHRPHGLLTVVPQPGQRSSLVWMGKPEKIASLNALPLEEFAIEIQLGCHGGLGLVSDISARQVFPMQSRRASRLARSRVFLVGEAAHSFPPIGAQGLNMSLRDVGHAADIILAADDPGNDAACEEYHQLRQIDLLPRLSAINAMNFSLLSDSVPLAALRSMGLAMVDAVPAIRKRVIEYGLAPNNLLPFAMRG